MANILDFFDPRKEFKIIPLKPGAREMRRAQEKDEMAGPPPETNKDLEDWTEAQWTTFRAGQEARLEEEAAREEGTLSQYSAVPGSNLEGVESCTTATVVSSRAVPRLPSGDIQNLWTTYGFGRQDKSWQVPIIEYQDRIQDIIGGNQIVVLSGPTGCGKSTQVPQYILNQHAMEKKNVNIVVTQPRKLAASSLAKRVCAERGWKLGGLVGYHVGLDKANKSLDTRLLFVTTGVLKRMIIGKKHLNDWTHIILDEVHEREEDMDLLLILCKKFLFTNSRNTKLILMSATLNEYRLRFYFSSKFPGNLNCPAPFLDVGHKKPSRVATRFYFDDLIKGHRLHKLKKPDFQLNSPTLDPTCVQLAKSIIIAMDKMEPEEGVKKPGAVLVFLPGIHEIQEVRDQLTERSAGDQDKGRLQWKIIPLHSSIPWEEHQLIYDEAPPRTRKIILATNIAESSLTIPDIRYVIDFGLTKNMQADPETNYPRLVLEWECHNQLIQRAGRAGRVTGDGRAYVLMPESLVHQLPEEHLPEMQRVPLTKVVLDVKMLDMGSPKEILALAMDPPAINCLLKSVVSLQEMKAMRLTVNGVQKRDDGDLTVLGEIVAKLPIDVKLGKLIFLGHIFGVLEEAIIIACGLNGKSIFTAPFDKKVQAYKNKLFWADKTFSDCHAILNAFNSWKQRLDRGDFHGHRGISAEKQFCRSSFLQRNQLQEMLRMVEDVKKSLAHLGIEPLRVQHPVTWEGDSKDVVLEVVMFGAFYPNYFTQQSPADVGRQANRTLFGRDPRHTVYLTGMKEEQGALGDIYAGQIKKMFEDCTKDEEKIHLTFKGSKVLVEFDQSGAQQDRWVEDRSQQADQEINMTGDILHQVYIASKLRFVNRNCHKTKIQVYNLEDAKNIHQEWEEAIMNAEKSLSTSNIQQLQPPHMGEEEIVISNVSHVSSPSMFWIHYGDSPEKMERIRNITEQVLVKCRPVRGGVQVGQVFLAPDSREGGDSEYLWYSRVRVTSVRASMVMAFFIDYGYTQFISVSKLRMIPPEVVMNFSDLVTIPGQAVECCLSGLQPNKARTVKGLWDEQVVTELNKLVKAHVGGELSAKIFSVTKSASSGNGFVVNLASLEVMLEGGTMDIAQELLKMKLASVAVESLTSQEDHKARLKYCAESAGIQKYMELDYFQSFTLKPELKAKEDSGKLREWVELAGPFTPLEQSILAQYRSGESKGAKVDPESVNCVILNKNLVEAHKNWLVAAHVGMRPNGESLGLRNTFWLSSKPGMGELLTMVFAPVVELRLKEGDELHRRRITGFIAGMGPKVHWNKTPVSRAEATEAFYPEHDMEVRFEVNVDNEDVNNVNELRRCINTMLARSPDGMMVLTQTKALHTTMRKIKTCLTALLDRQRRTEDVVVMPYNLVNRWNIQDPQLAMKGTTDVLSGEFWVYDWIDGLMPEKSREKKKENQSQVDMLLKLYQTQKSDQFSEEAFVYHEVCPICPSKVMLQNRRQVHLHLNSSEHKERESQVMGDLDSVTTISAATKATRA